MSHTLTWIETPTGRAGHMTTWAVTAFDGEGRKGYATHPLEYADAAREWHGYLTARPSTDRIEISETATELTERRISLEDLPTPGAPIDLPALPDGAHSINRHYRFNVGPRVLTTPEAVRTYLHWLRRQQEGDQPNAMRVRMETLQLFEVTRTLYERLIPLVGLPG